MVMWKYFSSMQIQKAFLKFFMAGDSCSHNSLDFSCKANISNQPTFIIKFLASNIV